MPDTRPANTGMRRPAWPGDLPARLGLGLSALALFALVWMAGQWIPQIFLRNPGMDHYDSSHFQVWAVQADHRAAIELRSVLEDRGGQALAFLHSPQFPAGRTEVYLYPDRLSFTLHRAGLWAAWADTAGLVSAERGGRYLLVSPDNPGLGHGRTAVARSVVTDWIRIRIREAAPEAALWLAEGVADYLAGSSRDDEDPQEMPDEAILVNGNRAVFLAAGGDRYADSFVAWLVWRHGADLPIRLLRAGPGWIGLLDSPLAGLHAAWAAWLKAGRPGDPRLRPSLPPVDEKE